MSTSTPKLHPEDKTHLFALHETFNQKARLTGCSTAAASFLILGALIVIGASCLCLTLPGVNVIQHVILPGVFPGSGALLLSLPFIYATVRGSRAKNAARKELIEFSIALINWHQVEDMPKTRQKTKFLYKNFIKSRWTKEYSSKLIKDIKERYPEEDKQTPRARKSLLKALDNTLQEIQKAK